MARLAKPARYLLRIDDLCPTVHAGRWDRLRILIEEFGIQPILAIVPDNRDRELDASPAAPEFWPQMRAMEAAGATIALHGYRHLCSRRRMSLVGFKAQSEFVGLALHEQRRRIASGIAILRGHGLNPKLWVAPGHGFDWNTLASLRVESIGHVSDGLARVPFRRGGVTWIPQQLWAPAFKRAGLWTICMHPNTTDRARFRELRVFLRRFASQFTCFERVVAESEASELDGFERFYEIIAAARLRVRRALKAHRIPKQPPAQRME